MSWRCRVTVCGFLASMLTQIPPPLPFRDRVFLCSCVSHFLLKGESRSWLSFKVSVHGGPAPDCNGPAVGQRVIVAGACDREGWRLGSREPGKTVGAKHTLQSHLLSDLLPPIRLYLPQHPHPMVHSIMDLSANQSTN